MAEASGAGPRIFDLSFAMLPPDQFERFRTQGFVLTTVAQDVPMQLKSTRGSVSLPEKPCQAVMAALSENDHCPKTVAELMAHPARRSLPPGHLIQTLVILTGAGDVHPTQREEAIEIARPRWAALNAYLCQRARHTGDAAYLASPVTGTGVLVPRPAQLFLLARQQGHAEPQTWARFVWAIIEAQGQRFIKDGKTFELRAGESRGVDRSGPNLCAQAVADTQGHRDCRVAFVRLTIASGPRAATTAAGEPRSRLI
jgi:hypothetical protein